MFRAIDSARFMGQFRPDDSVDQFAREEALRKAGLRPDLFPTDTTPMSLLTKANPGEVILREEGWILPLTQADGSQTLVYGDSPPAPDGTTDISFEDEIPRTQYNHDRILRSSNDVLPYNFGPYLGQVESKTTDFIYTRYDDAGYQTYPGRFLGQTDTEKFANRFMGLGLGMVALVMAAGVATTYFLVKALKSK